MEAFNEHVINKSKIIGRTISGDEEMLSLMREQQAKYDNATSVCACAKRFTDEAITAISVEIFCLRPATTVTYS